VVQRTLT